MKKLLILLSAVLLIASTFTFGIFADPYDEVQLPGLPDGVQGYEIEGGSAESYYDLFEITKKYFVASFTFPLEEKAGTMADNGCVGLTIGDEGYECFYVAHDIKYEDEGTRGPGFPPDDLRAQLRVGAWWGVSAFGAYQINYIDGQEGSITEDSLVGTDVTIYVEGRIDIEDEETGSWMVTIKAWINDTPLVLNGGEMEVTAYDFEANPYVGYGCKLSGVTAQIKFAQSNAEIDRNVLVNGVPDDTGMPGIGTYECPHRYARWFQDRDVHGVKCYKCGEIVAVEMHTFENGVCTYCGEEEILYGDANGDGKIDSRDIILLKKYIANFENGKSSVTLGHNIEVDPGYPATCTEDGVSDGKICTDCGKVLSTKNVIPAFGHNVDEWTVTKLPTCTEDGESEGICTQCGEKVIDILEGGHVEGDLIIDIEPTKTQNGFGHTECTVCGETMRTDVPINTTVDNFSHYFYHDSDIDETLCVITGLKDGVTDTELWIPNYIDGCKVIEIDSWAFSNCENITSVVIPDGVTTIGYEAFHNCTSLTNITIPDSVTNIGDSAFGWCESLTNINIPQGVTSIGYDTFYYCTSLTNITIPDSVTNIGDSAFGWCESLTNINIPQGVTSIGYDTFYYCTSLTNITIPDSVTTIGDSAFGWCESLTNINIPQGVTSIGDFTFYNCNLTNITIPDSVTTIGEHGFGWCESLTNINIPQGVTSIGNGTFYNCTSLTNVTLPDSVTTIGDEAFTWCTNLTTITIPNGITSIGDDAFDNCYRLKNVLYKGTSDEWLNISIGSDNSYLTDATLYYYSENKPTEKGNWWHFVDGIPTIWSATDQATVEGALSDSQTYGGLWGYDEETEHYICYGCDQSHFAVLPIGDGVVGESVTKYSLEVTTKEWGQSPEWGIIYGGKDGDGDGFLTENFDWYWLALCNGKNIAHARSRDTFDKWDELKKEKLIDIVVGEEVTMKIIVDISAKTVDFYLNDILIDTRNEETGELDFTGFGNMIGICCTIDDAEFWDLKYTPLDSI